MSAFRAFGHVTLHRRWTARTTECSAVRYIERETTFWAFHYMFRLHVHSRSLSLNQTFSEILKIFLEALNGFNVEVLTLLKTIKYHNSEAYRTRS